MKEPSEEQLKDLLAKVAQVACSDSCCVLWPERPRRGMRTNGGCRCLTDSTPAVRVAIRLALRTLFTMAIARLNPEKDQ